MKYTKPFFSLIQNQHMEAASALKSKPISSSSQPEAEEYSPSNFYNKLRKEPSSTYSTTLTKLGGTVINRKNLIPVSTEREPKDTQEKYHELAYFTFIVDDYIQDNTKTPEEKVTELTRYCQAALAKNASTATTVNQKAPEHVISLMLIEPHCFHYFVTNDVENGIHLQDCLQKKNGSAPKIAISNDDFDIALSNATYELKIKERQEIADKLKNNFKTTDHKHKALTAFEQCIQYDKRSNSLMD